MRIVLVVLSAAAFAAASLLSPASAQVPQSTKLVTQGETAKRGAAAERKRRQKEVDEAYRARTGSQPDAKPKANDPWANMR